jgi:1-acyl-sn-glycerol-3-phosphate acyltransferase
MKKLPYPKLLIKILRATFGKFLKHYYNIEFVDPKNIKELKEPFVIIINHSGFWDPFFICSYLTQEIHFVTSDNIFRHNIFKFFVKLFGSIPKSKFIPDVKTIKYIFSTIESNGSIGIFPETNRTWDGSCFPLNPNIGNLIKKLNVDLVGTIIKGGYLSLPRWAIKKRKGKVIIEFDYILKKEEIKELSANQIYEKANNFLNYNEDHFQDKMNIKFKGKNLAHYLERALFICPNCNSFFSLYSFSDFFLCKNCNILLKYNEYGRLVFPELKEFKKHIYLFKNEINKNIKINIDNFNTVHKWNKWQINFLINFLRNNFYNIVNNKIDKNIILKDFVSNFNINKVSKKEDIFIDNEKALIYKGFKLEKTKFLFKAFLSISFYYFLLLDENKNIILKFPILEMDGVNVQDKEILEFYYKNELYRIYYKNKRISIYKWLLFILSIKKLLIENIDLLYNNINIFENKDFIENLKSNKNIKLNIDNIFS